MTFCEFVNNLLYHFSYYWAEDMPCPELYNVAYTCLCTVLPIMFIGALLVLIVDTFRGWFK